MFYWWVFLSMYWIFGFSCFWGSGLASVFRNLKVFFCGSSLGEFFCCPLTILNVGLLFLIVAKFMLFLGNACFWIILMEPFDGFIPWELFGLWLISQSLVQPGDLLAFGDLFTILIIFLGITVANFCRFPLVLAPFWCLCFWSSLSSISLCLF